MKSHQAERGITTNLAFLANQTNAWSPIGSCSRVSAEMRLVIVCRDADKAEGTAASTALG